MRSLRAFASGLIRRIFIVVSGPSQIPAWLDVSHPQITVVFHDALFYAPGQLPTFSAFAIETVLHRIPGLSNVFFFFFVNNDFLFSRDVDMAAYLTVGANGSFTRYTDGGRSPRTPNCSAWLRKEYEVKRAAGKPVEADSPCAGLRLTE